jgi:hypothetical protein
MAQIQTQATKRLVELLRADDGFAAVCAELQTASDTAPTDIPVVLEQYVAADLAEKGSTIKYPVLHVYCDRVANKLTEKFRTFSGTASLVLEVRVTHDHITDLQRSLAFYVDAVTELLHRRRGDWGGGAFYTGGYEVAIQPVKRGGKNYLQAALVSLDVQISL